jgi:hypothetical protein
LKEGTYLVKAQDAGGNISATAATVTTKQATALTYGSLSTLTENPTFSGTKTDLVVVDSKLKIDGTTSIDAVADVDALGNWDGGASGGGTYAFSAGLDLTTETAVRLTSEIAATVTNVNDQVDSRSEAVDDWADFDGISGIEADAWVEVRETDDDPAGTPTWSAWKRLDAAEFSARAFEFRAQLVSTDPAYNIEISTLKVHKETVT